MKLGTVSLTVLQSSRKHTLLTHHLGSTFASHRRSTRRPFFTFSSFLPHTNTHSNPLTLGLQGYISVFPSYTNKTLTNYHQEHAQLHSLSLTRQLTNPPLKQPQGHTRRTQLWSDSLLLVRSRKQNYRNKAPLPVHSQELTCVHIP